MRRTALGLAIMLVAVFGVVSCSVPRNGRSGVTVDAEGNLMATIAACPDNPPDLVHLSGGGANKQISSIDVDYDAPPRLGRTLSLRLEAPADGWVAHPQPPTFVPDVDYYIRGLTRDNSNSTNVVRFRLADRDRLSPGTVLIQENNEDNTKEVDVLVSQQAFEERAKRFC